jgi:hypothetical protein
MAAKKRIIATDFPNPKLEFVLDRRVVYLPRRHKGTMVNSCGLPKSDWVGTRLRNDWIHLGPFPTCRPKEDDWVHEERMQLKAKNQSIAYHFIREGAARDEWRTPVCEYAQQ